MVGILQKARNIVGKLLHQPVRQTALQNVLRRLHRKSLGRTPLETGSRLGCTASKRTVGIRHTQRHAQKKFLQKGKPQRGGNLEQFVYPKLGPGQLWETVAGEVSEKGGEVITETPVKEIHIERNRVTSVTVETPSGERREVPCDYFLSSLPLKDLIRSIRGIDVPDDVKRIAEELPYRDFITVGLLMKKLSIKNRTKIKTFADRIPDTWIYIQERDVRIGRLQIFNNWSPYLVKDYENTIWIGLEYFCTEGDDFWEMPDKDFTQMAIGELAQIGIIDPDDVLDSVRIKVKKAYPSYFGSYYELDKVKDFLNKIENLWCIGRNGQHRYNNMDHSMMTAMVAVDHIATGNNDKSEVWSVNTEEEYHESK